MGELIRPQWNSKAWYGQYVNLKIDRLALLIITEALEFSLIHHFHTKQAAAKTRMIGECFSRILLDAGLIIPGNVKEAWEKAFQVKL